MQRDPRAPLFDVLQAAGLIRGFIGSIDKLPGLDGKVSALLARLASGESTT